MFVLGFALALSAACGGGGDEQTLERSEGPVRVAIVELRGDSGGSAVTGTATFRKAGNDRVRVLVDVDGFDDSRHAVHVHVRNCANEDAAVKHELPDLVRGNAEAVVNGSVQGHVGGGRSIGVHRTAEPTSGHVACGDVRTATFRRY